MEFKPQNEPLLADCEEEISGIKNGQLIDSRDEICFENSFRARENRRLSRITTVLIVVSLISLSLNVYTAWDSYTKGRSSDAFLASSNDNFASDLANAIPQMQVTFEGETNFSGAPSSTSDAAWNSLLPVGSGFVVIDDPQQLGLKPGIPTKGGDELYSVALFHQLHCLGILRSYYWELIDAAVAEDHNLTHTLASTQTNSPHTAHCFDYLRQALMCFGDMTLEGARVEDDGTRVQVDGWGMTHQCRRWESILDWTTRHKGPGALDRAAIAGHSSLAELNDGASGGEEKREKDSVKNQ